MSAFVCAEDIFGCSESSIGRFQHEQEQERARILQPRCWGFDIHSTKAIPEPKTYWLGSSGNRVVSVATSDK